MQLFCFLLKDIEAVVVLLLDLSNMVYCAHANRLKLLDSTSYHYFGF